uniref:MutS_IV domain-containing protein n=1 Tax=Heterorhabditis bacteriophora TaxID=37862 RepID=A0A1I7WRV5_HETBA
MVEMDFATYRALDIFAEHRKKELGWRRALKGCDSGRMIFRRMKGASAKVAHWKNLYETLGCLVSIGRLLSDADLRLELIEEEMEHFGEILAETTTVIAAIVNHKRIDFEESKTENRLVVNLGVDPELDETKNLYRKLPAILTDVAQDEANRLQAVSCSVGYVPMVGYLLALPADYPVHLFPDLQVIYSTENAIHVKSNRMNRLDEEMGDVKMQIIDRETTIMLREGHIRYPLDQTQ